jgi:LysM repeat protein
MKLRPIRSTATLKRKKPPIKLKASVSRTASRRQIEEFEDDEEDYYESAEPNMKLSHAFIVVLILHLIAVGGIFGFNAMKNRQATLAKIAAESGLVTTPNSAPQTTTANAPTAAGQPAPAPVAANTSAPAAANPAATATSGRTHEVVPGDTLTRIATKYGTTVESLLTTNNLTADSILRVGQVLQLPIAGTGPSAPSTPTTTTPATTATVAKPVAPAPATTSTANSAPPAPVASNPAPATATGETYEVVAGDNPYSIARKLKVSYQDLLEVNAITDPTKLQIGQKLKVPPAR